MTRYERRISVSLAAVLAAAALTIACGGSASMTGATSPAPAAGATAAIEGTVNAGAVAASQAGARSVGGIRVSVEGTGLTATTNASGRFSLSGVPPGSAVLRFEGTGIDARLTIDGLVGGQTLTIVVHVSGSQATLEGDDDENEIEAEGPIESLSPFKVAGKTFVVDAQTKIVDEKKMPIPFSSLKVGDKVEVDGVKQADGSLRAVKIKLEKGDEGDDDDHEGDDEGDDEG